MNTLPVIIGITLGIVLAIFARTTKFDRDRSYHAVVLIVIATYYVLFACMGNDAIVAEIFVASLFSIVAVLGALRWRILSGVGIFLHGVFDLIHGYIISNPGMPIWWPAFCSSIDIVLGLWVIFLVVTKRVTSD